MIKKSLMRVGILSLFILPGFTFAMNDQTSAVPMPFAPTALTSYSEEDLVALIAKLQKQLEVVRQNKVPCVLADADLSLGDGEDSTSQGHVKNLQNFLKEKGYFKNAPTGYFGKLTKAALIKFQKESGLEQTGELTASVRAYAKDLKCRKGFITSKAGVSAEMKGQAKNMGSVTSVTLKTEGNTVRWSAVGYAKSGFKVVWSKNPSPTYPTREGDKYAYLSDPSANSSTLDAFSGTGVYYVRVCEYLGGSCGVYSNEVTASL